MPSLGAEAPCVQNPLVKYAVETGWTYVSRDEAEERRSGSSGLFFYDLLGDKLLELNKKVLDAELAAEVIRRMQGLPASIEGNRDILLYLRGEGSVYHPGQKRELNVRLIDFDKSEKNIFEVTDEWSYREGTRKGNRADVVFLINGVPVIIVETKAAHRPDALEEGVEQIRRYHRETPEMVTSTQIFDVPTLLEWYYGVTWNMDRKNLFNWKDEQKGNYETKVKEFFRIDRILLFIRDYILFIKKDDELKKFILRQHQTRAVEKVVDRALDVKKRTGLIWHTQGSGKTFTMITAAEKLLRNGKLEKPLVVMLVDRNELETQLFQNLSACGFENVTVALSKVNLKKTLESDFRGLLVTMIHKFDKMPKDLNTSDRIIVLVDEAHRTTSGNLGNYLLGALPNATMIGFTGTPIDNIAKGKGTFKVFGKDNPPKGYLDKYGMAESIIDGTTKKLHYTLAPNDMLVDKETLEKEFLLLAEAEGISDIAELNKILDRAVNLKSQLKAHERVEKVAAFVAKHFRGYVEPMGFKAFLVGVDREACAAYKRELDKHLPPEYSQVVYSPSPKDGEQLKEFHLSGAEEKKVRKDFARKGKLPKILIVTEKLLTGYDAPILYCLYLDKPMRDHVLLQTIARVNRPYEDEEGLVKSYGFVLDFVGIFSRLKDALSFDSDEVGSVIEDVKLLLEHFAQLMAGEAREYLPFAPIRSSDKECERAIDHFSDKELRDKFFTFFRTIQSLYEILSPNPFLHDYIELYDRLARLCALLTNNFRKKVYADREFMAKTAELVRKHVSTDGVDAPLPTQALDEETLEALKASESPDTVKVINLIKRIRDAVDEEGEENPYLISIGDRAETVADLFDERQIYTQNALSALQKLVEEYNEAKREWRSKGLDAQTFALYWTLKTAGIRKAEELAKKAKEAFDAHPHWNDNQDEKRKLKSELYRVLMAPVGKDRIKGISDQLMKVMQG